MELMKTDELRAFLNEMVERYNRPEFIADDPIQIPHRYQLREDREIAGFFAATLAWGNRKSIIKSTNKLMDIMGESPYDYVMQHTPEQLERLEGFVHRTFNSIDAVSFVKSLQNIYANHGGPEAVLVEKAQGERLQEAIEHWRSVFFEIPHAERTRKHFSSPLSGSAAKRLNMYLRWMVRRDPAGVDLGLWKQLHPRQLSCPLDVHSGNVARKLGLLQRKQNDARALEELDRALRILDPEDPVKYDFALFGLGVYEKF